MICQNESEQNIDDNKLSEDSDLPFCMMASFSQGVKKRPRRTKNMVAMQRTDLTYHEFIQIF